MSEKRGGLEKFWTIFAIVAVVGASWAVQQQSVRDFWGGLGYEPSSQMAEIQESLELTGTGERIFKAVKPVLETSDNFNEHCQSNDAEVALLGCYTSGQIYVYEIRNDELRLANNVTTAHELLHAVWQRMGENEKAEVTRLLEEVKRDNEVWLDEELAAYDELEKLEEIYTRAGTKLKNLPDELEKHYGKYFKDRQKIVGYYEAYQAPFERLQGELGSLETEIKVESEAIKQKRDEYEWKANNLDSRIEKFNSCAKTANCFVSEAEFNRQRSGLLGEQSELEELRDDINMRIDANNVRIEKYNELQMSLGELNSAMNSNAEKIEKVKEGDF